MDCVFCQIIAGKISVTKVHELPSWLAIRDINPQAPVHVIVFPKEHQPRMSEWYPNGDVRFWAGTGNLLAVVADAAEIIGLKDYRIVINNGPGAGQQVPHLHAHILGGWPDGQAPGIGGSRE